MRWTVPTPTPNVEAIWRSPGLFFLLSAAWKARSVLSAWNLAAILLIAAISLIVMSSITPPTQQTYWRNFSNRPIEVAADEPRDLRRDVPEQRAISYHCGNGRHWPFSLPLLWQIYLRCRSLQIHFRQCGHRCGGGRAMSSRMAWRTPGKIGWGGGPLIPFFPLAVGRRRMLEEGICDHRHEHDGEGLARIAPRSDRNRVLLSAVGEPARKSISP